MKTEKDVLNAISLLLPDVRYIARDDNGGLYVYTDPVEKFGEMYVPLEGRCVRINCALLPSITPADGCIEISKLKGD